MPDGKIITPGLRGRKKDQGIVQTEDPPAVVQNIVQPNRNTELKIDNAKEQVYRPEALVAYNRPQTPNHKKATSNSSGKAAPSTPKQGAKRPRESNSPERTQTPNRPAKTGSAKKKARESNTPARTQTPNKPAKTGSAGTKTQASPAHTRTPGSASKRNTMTNVREKEQRASPLPKPTKTKNSGAKRRLDNQTGQPCELCASTVSTTEHKCGYTLCYYCTKRKLKTNLDGCLMCAEESVVPQNYKKPVQALRARKS